MKDENAIEGLADKLLGMVGFLATHHCDPAVVVEAASQLLAMKEALEDLGQWAAAYPVAIFPEPDLDRVTAILTEAGEREQMDRMHASWARHLLSGIEDRALKALAPPTPSEKAK